VDDLVEGITRLFLRGTADPVNIGNPDEFTVLQLAELVLQLTGAPGPIVRKPLPVDDPRVRQPDIGLARRALDWAPTVSLEDGLRRTITYFRERLGA
jgi:nucleoside-diphosphate-sugar epimerase